jgi:hypothetical protein
MRTITIATAVMCASFATASAAELDLPARKAGQWRIEMQPEGGPAMVTEVCLDAETDKAMMQAGMSMSESMCSTMNVTNDGGTISIDATCAMGPMKTTSHTVMSGDFQSAYDVTITSAIEGGPPGMPANSTMTQHAQWTGDCANGMQPGDMTMPGGMRMNVRDMMGMMGGG